MWEWEWECKRCGVWGIINIIHDDKKLGGVFVGQYKIIFVNCHWLIVISPGPLYSIGYTTLYMHAGVQERRIQIQDESLVELLSRQLTVSALHSWLPVRTISFASALLCGSHRVINPRLSTTVSALLSPPCFSDTSASSSLGSNQQGASSTQSILLGRHLVRRVVIQRHLHDFCFGCARPVSPVFARKVKS